MSPVTPLMPSGPLTFPEIGSSEGLPAGTPTGDVLEVDVLSVPKPKKKRTPPAKCEHCLQRLPPIKKKKVVKKKVVKKEVKAEEATS